MEVNMQVLILLLLLVSCGREETNPELHGYVNEFYDRANELDITVSTIPYIQFKELEERVLGQAYRHNKAVEISPSWWSEMSERSKKALIYHELIHAVCLFHDHTEDETDIMYPYHRFNYIDRLTEEQYNAFLINGIKKWCTGLDWYTKPIKLEQTYITDW
jgi:hypothetical protein